MKKTAKKCKLCGKSGKSLKGEYYKTPDGKQVFLCNKCLTKKKKK